MRYLVTLIAVLLLYSCDAATRPSLPELRTVPSVELKRYAGEWYEIARFSHPFQKDCYGSKATYSLLENGKVHVLNECRRGGPDGEYKTAKGTAQVADKETNAKLKVTFFWPFSGDYWIIDLGKEYEYAVVGHPSRKYLWILSRTETIGDRVYGGILKRLEAQYYDTSGLIRTAH